MSHDELKLCIGRTVSSLASSQQAELRMYVALRMGKQTYREERVKHAPVITSWEDRLLRYQEEQEEEAAEVVRLRAELVKLLDELERSPLPEDGT